MAAKVIDVIVPLYNNEKYAIDAINSALAQSLPPRKIIVVDDGSIDRSAAIVEDYFAENPKVEVLRVKHGGLPHARNRGIEKSDAEFIAFLDSDDIWYREKLECQMAVFEANPEVGLVYCAYNDIDSDGKPLSAPHRLIPRLRGYVHQDILAGNLISGGSAAVVRRDYLTHAGPFDECLSFGEDWDMWLRLAKLCPFDYVGDALLDIRRHPVQMTAGNSYIKRRRRLTQHLAIWAKWPDEVSRDSATLQTIFANIITPCLKQGISFRRRMAILHVINKKIIARTHPRLYKAACGSDLQLFCQIVLRVVARHVRAAARKCSMGSVRGWLVIKFPWLRQLKRKLFRAAPIGEETGI